MAILWDDKNKVFSLHTKHTTYQMKVDQFGFLLHTYYGSRIQDDASYLLVCQDRGFSPNPYEAENDRTYSLDALPQEYPFHGSGDYRTTVFDVCDGQNISGCSLKFHSHQIIQGKYALDGLPAVYADVQQAETLMITLKDERLHLDVVLYYGVLADEDVITRAVKVTNRGQQTLTLAKALSASVDVLTGDLDLVHFYGRHAGERTMERTRLEHGAFSIGSYRGTSSHQHNPFVIVAERETTERSGDCFGMCFVYSGNFQCVAEKDQYGQTRVTMGIAPERFQYELAPLESFTAPEVILSYSDAGFETLSHRYHHVIRHHVCRGAYKLTRRPILINNWEATYFDFDGHKLFDIAKQASELGVEMMVLDDGWFGSRNSDNEGLGDWWVNEDKLQGSMREVSARICALGMKFGLWIEPEMVNENSKLYREHPDWAFTIPGKKPVRGRNQLVLDFSRPEVVDYVCDHIFKVLDDAHVSYVKMDMNRSISDVYSAVKGQPSEGKVLYRYMLGVYDFMERLLTRYPDLLLEGCSGGGGRFDAGMMYYSPQIWCSDNTDAISRLHIQYGTSFAYPISTVGSHVSTVPNHQTGRIVDFNTRGIVAIAGSFGYELDLNLVSDAEKQQVRQQVEAYKKYWHLLHDGKYYRLTDCERDHDKAAWMFVAEDRSEALVQIVKWTADCNGPVLYVRCRGLDPDAIYVADDGLQYSGAVLMHAGIPVHALWGEYQAYQLHFVRQNEQ